MFEDSTHGGRQNWWLRYPTFLRTSTHALTEGDKDSVAVAADALISTHALTEGDIMDYLYRYMQCISTHALTEGDVHLLFLSALKRSFQLTPSRRATEYIFNCNCLISHFNSRPHGGRHRED